MNDFPAAFHGLPMAVAESHAGPWLREISAHDGEVKISTASENRDLWTISRGVAILPIRGILTKRSWFAEWMGWATYEGIESAMRALAVHDEVKTIALDLDSPGGAAYGCAAAARAIAEVAKIKPVLAFVDPLAASAAYWLASQAREIVLSPGGAVGSIGVAVSLAKAVQPDMGGDQWFEFVSSHAPNKRPDPQTEEGRAEIRRELDEIEADFLGAVASGRRVTTAAAQERFGAGGVLYDAAAVSAGLADRIATRASFYEAILAPGGRSPRRAALAQAAAAQARARL
ncbi:S49 family peptidase [Neomegalonema perideroedes]|uniref:S49 family peptidase n=1 Tax=Neomegalonema perideroedes TaxID=217219 RepID=UPI00035EDD29|nr:S49 family peptidase [Neomegalonema perideroedes]